MIASLEMDFAAASHATDSSAKKSLPEILSVSFNGCSQSDSG
jgi:hypothetical protein